MKPLCFVLMPFGRKSAAGGTVIEFDKIYHTLIAPAIEEAGLEPLRADEEQTGGIIHKPMFERLILCPYAVADLTLANANVYYELGVRHAVRPFSTVPVIAQGQRLPFDVQDLRALHYSCEDGGAPGPAGVDEFVRQLAAALNSARSGALDSPVFQLVEGMRPPEIPHEKTDVFRDRVAYCERWKAKLSEARRQGAEAVRAAGRELGNAADAEAGIVIDLFLSYRSRKAWDDMIALAGRMAPPLQQAVMVQEQLALALNRAGRREEAEAALKKLIERRGPSSETCGILGRVYKDQWEEAWRAGDEWLAAGLLEKALQTYLQGFETDWRDAYPGVNACTLMAVRTPPDPRLAALLPVVRYAVERKIAKGRPDYWDYATLLELAVIEANETRAREELPRALAAARETWEPETTVRNLGLLAEARRRNEPLAWTEAVEKALTARSAQLAGS